MCRESLEFSRLVTDAAVVIPGSSKGRTAPFGGAYRGSNPRPGAKRTDRLIFVSPSADSTSTPIDPQLSAVIVLAAGQGTRMKSSLPKVLHSVLGRTLVEHVLHAVAPLKAQHTVVVVGHGRELVLEKVSSTFPSTLSAVQELQNGTGHAVAVALEVLPTDLTGAVLVVAGDTPLLTTHDIASLVAEQSSVSAAVLTAEVSDAKGYGRIIRNSAGELESIVEHKDATDEQLRINEVNSGVYIFDIAKLRSALARVGTNNSQGEQYLTDVIGILRADGDVVRASITHEDNILGVNDRRQLAMAGAILRKRIVDEWLLSGVTMIDPSSVWIDPTVALEPDSYLRQNVTLTGQTTIAKGADVGPDSSLHDTVVEAGAHVSRTTALGAQIGAGATVGPYTYLRPGTVLGPQAKAGGFVEMKNAQLGEGAKVPHLSYVGDATIGEGTNIGAATIFVNYDGVEKHSTTIGKHVRIGSDTMLVAPIVVGDGAYTAAGSVITEDVPAGSMAVGRARQRNILNWVLRRRPGSDSAKAAVAD